MSLRAKWAHFTAKSASRLMRIFGKRGSQLPGAIALQVDPQFIQQVAKPTHCISISGCLLYTSHRWKCAVESRNNCII